MSGEGKSSLTPTKRGAGKRFSHAEGSAHVLR